MADRIIIKDGYRKFNILKPYYNYGQPIRESNPDKVNRMYIVEATVEGYEEAHTVLFQLELADQLKEITAELRARGDDQEGEPT